MENVSSSNSLEKCPKLRFPHFSDQWKEISFGKLFTYISNNTLSRAELNYKAGEYKNVHYGDVLIKFGPILDVSSEKLPFITDCTENKIKNIVLKDGDVIIADTAEDETVGKATEIINVGVQRVVSGLHTIACRPQIEMEPMYLGFYINSEIFRRQLYSLMQGIKVLSISKSNIENTVVRYPQRTEQKKICLLLNLMEAKIKKQYKLIETLKKYKRGLVHNIFSDISSWTEYCVSDIGTVITGNTPPTSKPENYIGNCLFCAPGDLGKTKYISVTEKHISVDALNKNRKVPAGSILVTCIGSTIGKIGIAEYEMLTNQQINSLIVSEKHCNEFVYYALEYNFPRFLSFVGKQAVPILSKGQFEDLQIALPLINIQKKYAKLIAVLDSRIECSNKLLECLLLQRNSLLQQLFI